MNSTLRVLTIVITSFIFLNSTRSLASMQSLNYQGRIVKTNGAPLESNAVSFQFEVRSTNTPSCVLYREQIDNINMTDSKGIFDVAIGLGAKSFPVGAFKFLDSFDNTKSLNCEDGTVFTPAASETRLLRVKFYDGSAWNMISPDTKVRPVPTAGYSLNSSKLEGKSANEFAPMPANCAANKVLTFNGGNFACVTDQVATGSYITDLIGDVTTAAGGGSATSTLAKIQGKALTITSLTSGDTLKYNGTAWVNSPLSQSDISGTVSASSLPAFSGGDVSSSAGSAVLTLKNTGTAGTYVKVTTDAQGRVTSGASTLSNADISDLAFSKLSGKPTTLSGYGITDSLVKNDGAVPSLKSGVYASRGSGTTTGEIYIATDTEQILRWDGSAWQTMANNSTSSPISSVTAPLNISSGTLAIPAAATAQNGYLSSTDWNTFNNKLGTTLNAGQIWVGNGSNSAVARAPGGDVSMDASGASANFTVSKIQNRSVASTAPADGQVLLWDNGNTTWAPNYVRMQDIRNAWGGTQMIPSTACTAAQTMVWSVVTDRFSCQAINVDGTYFKNGGNAFAGNAIIGSTTASSRLHLRTNNTDWLQLEADGALNFFNNNSTSTFKKFGSLYADASDNTNGNEDTGLSIKGYHNGVWKQGAYLSPAYNWFKATVSTDDYFNIADYNSAGNAVDSADMYAWLEDNTAGSEDGAVGFGVIKNGSWSNSWLFEMIPLYQTAYFNDLTLYTKMTNKGQAGRFTNYNAAGNASGRDAFINIEHYRGTYSQGFSKINLMNQAGTSAAPTPIGANDIVGILDFYSRDNTGALMETSNIVAFTSSTFDGTAGKRGGGIRMNVNTDSGSFITGLQVNPTGSVNLGNSSTAGIAATFYNSSGNCTISPTTSTLSCSSDIRLKKDLQRIPSSEALDKVLNLNAMTYHWKNGDDGKRHIGYVAQEVEKTIPEVVIEGEDGFKQVGYSAIVPMITEALKEIWREVSGQSAVIAKLQNENAELRSYLCTKDPQAHFCK